MTNTVELYCYPGSDRVTKAMIAAKYAGISVTTPEFVFRTDNKKSEYLLNCHPLGKVPVAKTCEGYLFESNAIVRYISRLDRTGGLYCGDNAYDAARVDQWIDFTANEVEPGVNVIVGPILGYLEKVEEQQSAASKATLVVFEALDKMLEVRTFLVGERVTAADVVLGTLLEKFFRLVTDKKYKENKPNLMRYVDTCINQPNFQAVLQELAKKCPVKKEAESGGKKKEAESGGKKKEAESGGKKKKDKKDDDEDDDGAAAAAGQFPPESGDKALKAILDSLPPSAFIFDEFKRCYSNNDTRAVAAPFFFDKYDPEGYTCFYATYKYNDELTQQAFMTANLVGGWFQRMDHLHKYLFASVVICGDNKKQNISGFFVVRGKGMPELMSNVDDIENYDWKEIKDIKAEKEKITDYLACDGKTFENNPVMDYRIYK